MRDLRKYITILFFVPIAYVQGQSATSDSLTLSGILNTVMSDYPSLKRVEKELMSADAKIDLTKTAYLPDVSFSTSYDRIGPVTSIDMPINGAIHLRFRENSKECGSERKK